MDKRLKSFLNTGAVILILLATLFGGVVLIYRYSTLHTYNFIIYIVAIAVFFTLVYTLSVFYLFFNIYVRKKSGKILSAFLKRNLNLFSPMVIYLAGLFGKNKDMVRGFVVEVNNILAGSRLKKYSPDKILVLLPHCLQESNCIYKVTNNIQNCRMCGKCCIGDMKRLAKETGVEFKVVTGGTVARSIILESKPEFIISVACERDLASGISDVKSIPVMGIINDRKNGPCYNTSVNVKVVEQKLKSILK